MLVLFPDEIRNILNLNNPLANILNQYLAVQVEAELPVARPSCPQDRGRGPTAAARLNARLPISMSPRWNKFPSCMLNVRPGLEGYQILTS